jgi:2-haloacid dehalogenase
VSVELWATFDCYGTLVDWNAGVASGLRRVFGDDGQLDRYHAVEREIQAEHPGERYREVMARTLERLAAERGHELAAGERDLLGASLPRWPVFGEVPPSLRELRERGWRMAILSNTDRDLIESSMRSIGVAFELAIVASEIGSYKPAHGHWKAFYERTGADPAGHVHVAASLFHDVEPCNELGIPCVWINRLSERPSSERPAAELPDLGRLADAIEEVLPAPGRPT